MKKLLLVALVSMFSIVAFAQESTFGVKAGVNFAKITGDDLEDASGRTGFHVGAIAEFPLSEQFSIQPEAVYSQQGLEYDDFGFDIKLKLDYINIPIMAKYYFSTTRDLAIEFGPQIGILMNAKAEADGDEEDVKDDVKGSDISVGGGLSYQMETGWFAQARYMFGVSDINDTDDENTFGDNFTNSVLSISIGYRF